MYTPLDRGMVLLQLCQISPQISWGAVVRCADFFVLFLQDDCMAINECFRKIPRFLKGLWFSGIPPGVDGLPS